MNSSTMIMYQRLLAARAEEPSSVRQYIREALYRSESGIEQVDPNVWFKAPRDWEAPAEAEQAYKILREA